MNQDPLTLKESLIVIAIATVIILSAIGVVVGVTQFISNQEVSEEYYDYLNSLDKECQQLQSMQEAVQDGKVSVSEYEKIKNEIEQQNKIKKAKQLKDNVQEQNQFKINI